MVLLPTRAASGIRRGRSPAASLARRCRLRRHRRSTVEVRCQEFGDRVGRNIVQAIRLPVDAMPAAAPTVRLMSEPPLPRRVRPGSEHLRQGASCQHRDGLVHGGSEVGGEAVVEQVQKSLGVDREMAESIMSEGAIDISQAVKEVLDPFLRQMMISRDFVERQENCRVATTFITGGMSLSRYWAAEFMRATGMEVQPWDPMEGLAVAPGAVPQRLQGQPCRFSAAIGAARGAMTAS